MPQIDWTAPIETVPCERNPLPVPCEVTERSDGRAVRVLGPWLDDDGTMGGGDGYAWKVTPDGTFRALDGAVRNVVAPEQLPTPGTAPEQVDPIAAARATLEAAGYSVTAPDPEAARLAAARELMACLEEASESTRSIPTMWRDGSYDGEALRAYDYLTTWAALRASGAA